MKKGKLDMGNCDVIPVEEKNNRLQEEMRDCKRNKRLIPFVGAGFSANISGYPCWEDFIDILSDQIDIPLFELSTNPNKISEFYMWYKGKDKEGANTRKEIYNEGKSEFRDKVKSVFDNQSNHAEGQDWEQHKILVEHFDEIYTTNWDQALEIAAQDTDKIGTKFFSADRDMIKESIAGEGTEKSGDNGIEIIKLHGDCFYSAKNQKEGLLSIMAGQTDFVDRIKKSYAIDNLFLYDLIKGKSFLFIGYSFSDPNIEYTLSHVRDMLTFVEKSNRSVETKFYWLILDDPKTRDDNFQTFSEHWKKFYTFYLFAGHDEEFKRFSEYKTKHEEFRKKLREKWKKGKCSDAKEIKLREAMEKVRKEQQSVVASILIPLLNEITKDKGEGK